MAGQGSQTCRRAARPHVSSASRDEADKTSHREGSPTVTVTQDWPHSPLRKEAARGHLKQKTEKNYPDNTYIL